jgi:GxxExxY protein
MNTDKTQAKRVERVGSGWARYGLALDEQEYEALTEKVLGAVFEVSNTLGAGFLEKVYERALVRELGFRGIRATAQAPLPVSYKGYAVGEYFIDILVEDVLAVELKCVERLANEHTAQCLNYLRASGLSVCLLVNFQRAKVEWRRILETGKNGHG